MAGIYFQACSIDHSTKLAAYDVYIWDQMEQSLRIEGSWLVRR